MRKTSIMLVLCVLAGCSQDANEPQSSDTQILDAQEEVTLPSMPPSPISGQRMGPPAIGPSAAPGVAFNYRYDFRLAPERISAVQERHAQACERLGVDRCRITGMQYRLVGEEDVAAMLAFRLEPGLARQFGKDGIAAVGEAEGMLAASEISGIDEGANISAATGAEARLTAERARIEARLRGRLSDDERSRLTSELSEIRRSLDASRAGRAGSERALKGTPMVFNYGSGDIVPGFRPGSRLGDAFQTAGETLIGALAALIVVTGALLPIAALVLLLMLAWRWLRPTALRWRDASAAT